MSNYQFHPPPIKLGAGTSRLRAGSPPSLTSNHNHIDTNYKDIQFLSKLIEKPIGSPKSNNSASKGMNNTSPLNSGLADSENVLLGQMGSSHNNNNKSNFKSNNNNSHSHSISMKGPGPGCSSVDMRDYINQPARSSVDNIRQKAELVKQDVIRLAREATDKFSEAEDRLNYVNANIMQPEQQGNNINQNQSDYQYPYNVHHSIESATLGPVDLNSANSATMDNRNSNSNDQQGPGHVYTSTSNVGPTTNGIIGNILKFHNQNHNINGISNQNLNFTPGIINPITLPRSASPIRFDFKMGLTPPLQGLQQQCQQPHQIQSSQTPLNTSVATVNMYNDRGTLGASVATTVMPAMSQADGLNHVPGTVTGPPFTQGYQYNVSPQGSKNSMVSNNSNPGPVTTGEGNGSQQQPFLFYPENITNNFNQNLKTSTLSKDSSLNYRLSASHGANSNSNSASAAELVPPQGPVQKVTPQITTTTKTLKPSDSSPNLERRRIAGLQIQQANTMSNPNDNPPQPQYQPVQVGFSRTFSRSPLSNSMSNLHQNPSTKTLHVKSNPNLKPSGSSGGINNNVIGTTFSPGKRLSNDTHNALDVVENALKSIASVKKLELRGDKLKRIHGQDSYSQTQYQQSNQSQSGTVGSGSSSINNNQNLNGNNNAHNSNNIGFTDYHVHGIDNNLVNNIDRSDREHSHSHSLENINNDIESQQQQTLPRKLSKGQKLNVNLSHGRMPEPSPQNEVENGGSENHNHNLTDGDTGTYNPLLFNPEYYSKNSVLTTSKDTSSSKDSHIYNLHYRLATVTGVPSTDKIQNNNSGQEILVPQTSFNNNSGAVLGKEKQNQINYEYPSQTPSDLDRLPLEVFFTLIFQQDFLHEFHYAQHQAQHLTQKLNKELYTTVPLLKILVTQKSAEEAGQLGINDDLREVIRERLVTEVEVPQQQQQNSISLTESISGPAANSSCVPHIMAHNDVATELLAQANNSNEENLIMKSLSDVIVNDDDNKDHNSNDIENFGQNGPQQILAPIPEATTATDYSDVPLAPGPDVTTAQSNTSPDQQLQQLKELDQHLQALERAVMGNTVASTVTNDISNVGQFIQQGPGSDADHAATKSYVPATVVGSTSPISDYDPSGYNRAMSPYVNLINQIQNSAKKYSNLNNVLTSSPLSQNLHTITSGNGAAAAAAAGYISSQIQQKKRVNINTNSNTSNLNSNGNNDLLGQNVLKQSMSLSRSPKSNRNRTTTVGTNYRNRLTQNKSTSPNPPSSSTYGQQNNNSIKKSSKMIQKTNGHIQLQYISSTEMLAAAAAVDAKRFMNNTNFHNRPKPNNRSRSPDMKRISEMAQPKKPPVILTGTTVGPNVDNVGPESAIGNGPLSPVNQVAQKLRDNATHRKTRMSRNVLQNMIKGGSTSSTTISSSSKKILNHNHKWNSDLQPHDSAKDSDTVTNSDFNQSPLSGDLKQIKNNQNVKSSKTSTHPTVFTTTTGPIRRHGSPSPPPNCGRNFLKENKKIVYFSASQRGQLEMKKRKQQEELLEMEQQQAEGEVLDEQGEKQEIGNVETMQQDLNEQLIPEQDGQNLEKTDIVDPNPIPVSDSPEVLQANNDNDLDNNINPAAEIQGIIEAEISAIRDIDEPPILTNEQDWFHNSCLRQSLIQELQQESNNDLGLILQMLLERSRKLISYNNHNADNVDESDNQIENQSDLFHVRQEIENEIEDLLSDILDGSENIDIGEYLERNGTDVLRRAENIYTICEGLRSLGGGGGMSSSVKVGKKNKNQSQKFVNKHPQSESDVTVPKSSESAVPSQPKTITISQTQTINHLQNDDGPGPGQGNGNGNGTNSYSRVISSGTPSASSIGPNMQHGGPPVVPSLSLPRSVSPPMVSGNHYVNVVRVNKPLTGKNTHTVTQSQSQNSLKVINSLNSNNSTGPGHPNSNVNQSIQNRATISRSITPPNIRLQKISTSLNNVASNFRSSHPSLHRSLSNKTITPGYPTVNRSTSNLSQQSQSRNNINMNSNLSMNNTITSHSNCQTPTFPISTEKKTTIGPATTTNTELQSDNNSPKNLNLNNSSSSPNLMINGTNVSLNRVSNMSPLDLSLVREKLTSAKVRTPAKNSVLKIYGTTEASKLKIDNTFEKMRLLSESIKETSLNLRGIKDKVQSGDSHSVEDVRESVKSVQQSHSIDPDNNNDSANSNSNYLTLPKKSDRDNQNQIQNHQQFIMGVPVLSTSATCQEDASANSFLETQNQKPKSKSSSASNSNSLIEEGLSKLAASLNLNEEQEVKLRERGQELLVGLGLYSNQEEEEERGQLKVDKAPVFQVEKETVEKTNSGNTINYSNNQTVVTSESLSKNSNITTTSSKSTNLSIERESQRRQYSSQKDQVNYNRLFTQQTKSSQTRINSFKQKKSNTDYPYQVILAEGRDDKQSTFVVLESEEKLQRSRNKSQQSQSLNKSFNDCGNMNNNNFKEPQQLDSPNRSPEAVNRHLKRVEDGRTLRYIKEQCYTISPRRFDPKSHYSNVTTGNKELMVSKFDQELIKIHQSHGSASPVVFDTPTDDNHINGITNTVNFRVPVQKTQGYIDTVIQTIGENETIAVKNKLKSKDIGLYGFEFNKDGTGKQFNNINNNDKSHSEEIELMKPEQIGLYYKEQEDVTNFNNTTILTSQTESQIPSQNSDHTIRPKSPQNSSIQFNTTKGGKTQDSSMKSELRKQFKLSSQTSSSSRNNNATRGSGSTSRKSPVPRFTSASVPGSVQMSHRNITVGPETAQPTTTTSSVISNARSVLVSSRKLLNEGISALLASEKNAQQMDQKQQYLAALQCTKAATGSGLRSQFTQQYSPKIQNDTTRNSLNSRKSSTAITNSGAVGGTGGGGGTGTHLYYNHHHQNQLQSAQNQIQSQIPDNSNCNVPKTASVKPTSVSARRVRDEKYSIQNRGSSDTITTGQKSTGTTNLNNNFDKITVLPTGVRILPKVMPINEFSRKLVRQRCRTRSPNLQQVQQQEPEEGGDQNQKQNQNERVTVTTVQGNYNNYSTGESQIAKHLKKNPSKLKCALVKNVAKQLKESGTIGKFRPGNRVTLPPSSAVIQTKTKTLNDQIVHNLQKYEGTGPQIITSNNTRSTMPSVIPTANDNQYDLNTSNQYDLATFHCQVIPDTNKVLQTSIDPELEDGNTDPATIQAMNQQIINMKKQQLRAKKSSSLLNNSQNIHPEAAKIQKIAEKAKKNLMNSVNKSKMKDQKFASTVSKVRLNSPQFEVLLTKEQGGDDQAIKSKRIEEPRSIQPEQYTNYVVGGPSETQSGQNYSLSKQSNVTIHSESQATNIIGSAEDINEANNMNNNINISKTTQILSNNDDQNLTFNNDNLNDTIDINESQEQDLQPQDIDPERRRSKLSEERERSRERRDKTMHKSRLRISDWKQKLNNNNSIVNSPQDEQIYHMNSNSRNSNLNQNSTILDASISNDSTVPDPPEVLNTSDENIIKQGIEGLYLGLKQIEENLAGCKERQERVDQKLLEKAQQNVVVVQKNNQNQNVEKTVTSSYKSEQKDLQKNTSQSKLKQPQTQVASGPSANSSKSSRNSSSIRAATNSKDSAKNSARNSAKNSARGKNLKPPLDHGIKTTSGLKTIARTTSTNSKDGTPMAVTASPPPKQINPSGLQVSMHSNPSETLSRDWARLGEVEKQLQELELMTVTSTGFSIGNYNSALNTVLNTLNTDGGFKSVRSQQSGGRSQVFQTPGPTVVEAGPGGLGNGQQRFNDSRSINSNDNYSNVQDHDVSNNDENYNHVNTSSNIRSESLNLDNDATSELDLLTNTASDGNENASSLVVLNSQNNNSSSSGTTANLTAATSSTTSQNCQQSQATLNNNNVNKPPLSQTSVPHPLPLPPIGSMSTNNNQSPCNVSVDCFELTYDVNREQTPNAKKEALARVNNRNNNSNLDRSAPGPGLGGPLRINSTSGKGSPSLSNRGSSSPTVIAGGPHNGHIKSNINNINGPPPTMTPASTTRPYEALSPENPEMLRILEENKLKDNVE